MKKAILTMVAIAATAVGTSAQGLTATLQQGDKMTPFYGPDAFVEAYKAAQSGAVITLSAGEFNTVDSITKQVTIVGNGCVTHDGTERTYIIGKKIKHYGSERDNTSLIINASNVKVEGVYAYNVYLRNVTNTHFSNCYIFDLYAYNQHENTVIDQCYLYYDDSLPKSLNACYKNSYIYLFYLQNTTTNLAYFCNCLIYNWYSCYKADSNTTYNYQSPYGIYKNCILGFRNYNYDNASSTSENYWKGFYLKPTTQYSVNEYYNNVFYLYPYKYTKNSQGNWTSEYSEEMANKELKFDWTETQSRKNNKTSTWTALTNEGDDLTWWQKLKTNLPFKGDDGKDVGPYGGTGFNINPAIPRIVESTIDSNTDASGHLNVKIKVELNN